MNKRTLMLISGGILFAVVAAWGGDIMPESEQRVPNNLKDVRYIKGRLIMVNKAHKVYFTPNGRKMAVTANCPACDANPISFYDAQSKRPLGVMAAKGMKITRDVSFSADGKMAVNCSTDNKVRIWNVEAPCMIGKAMEFPDFEPMEVVFNETATEVIARSNDGVMRWDLKNYSPALRSPVEFDERQGGRGGMTAAELSDDGTCVVSGYADGSFVLWNTNTGKAICPPTACNLPVNEAAWGANGEAVTLVRFSADKTRLFVYHANGASVVWNLNISSAESSWINKERPFEMPEWDVLIRIQEHGAALHAAPDVVGKPVLHDSPVTDAAFSPDASKVICSKKSNFLEVWEAETMECLRRIDRRRPGNVGAVAFSPYSDKIACVLDNAFVHVWLLFYGGPEPEKPEEWIMK